MVEISPEILEGYIREAEKMDLAEGIKNRRAIRKFKNKPVPKGLLEEVFELARWSPVPPLFRQWRYIVVTNEKKRDRLVECISKSTVYLRDLLDQFDEETRQKALDYYPDLGGAPVIVFVLIPVIDNQWDRRNLIIAATTELQNLLLAVYYYGLGTCGVTMAPWVEGCVKGELGLENEEILCSLAIGYPDEKPTPDPHERVETTYLE